MTWTPMMVRSRVEELLRSVGVSVPPVPVERIARLLGAELRLEVFEGDLSGMLYRGGGRVVIGVNASHPKTRQRFTIAHELAHLILHQRDNLHLDRDFRVHLRNARSSQATDPDEIAANRFAAELLMPASMIQNDVGDTSIDVEDDATVRRLSARYRVSVQAMILRLKNLNLIEPNTDQ